MGDRYEALVRRGMLRSYHSSDDKASLVLATTTPPTAKAKTFELCIVADGTTQKLKLAASRGRLSTTSSSSAIVVTVKDGNSARDLRRNAHHHRLNLQTNGHRAVYSHMLWAVTVTLIRTLCSGGGGGGEKPILSGFVFYDVDRWYGTPGAADASVECPHYIISEGYSQHCDTYRRHQLASTLATPAELSAPALYNNLPDAVRGAFLRAKLPNATLGLVQKYNAFATDALLPTLRALQDWVHQSMVRAALESSNATVRRNNGSVIESIKSLQSRRDEDPAACNLLDAYRGVEQSVDDFLSSETQSFGSGVLGLFTTIDSLNSFDNFWTIQVRADDRLDPKDLLAPVSWSQSK